MKRILITGANGFVGKNLTVELRTRKSYEVLTFDIENTREELEERVVAAEFIVHLAGVNRPKDEKEFDEGNKGLTEQIIDILRKNNKKTPLLLSSSTQADRDNAYGISKRGAEEAVEEWMKEAGVPSYIYRFTNVFGKWCRPNYNSAVATFCYNIAHDLPIQVNDPQAVVRLIYIDDLQDEVIRAIEGNPNKKEGFCEVEPVYTRTLGEIAALLYGFRGSRADLTIGDMSDGFAKKLYSTYLSYLPEEAFSYPLKMNVDHRGSFTEILRTVDRGQVSVNISKPGITKGNHWHHTKTEKFIVVSGNGLIQFRKIGTDQVIDYHVSGEKIEVVDIPPGYTHNIINEGDTDLVTVMWCNECFDPNRPDTYFEEV